MEDKHEEQAELDPFSHNAKSSVRIKQTTRGPTWDIKVVTGEKDLIDDLMLAALEAYKKINTKLNQKEVKQKCQQLRKRLKTTNQKQPQILQI